MAAGTKAAGTREVRRSATAAGGERAAALVRAATGLSHAMVRGLFAAGCVRCGAAPLDDPAALLAPGQRLEVRYEPGRRYRPKARAPVSRAFRLVYEDAHLLVVDKAAGVLTMPNKGEPDTLLDALRAYVGRGQRRPPRLFVVHRLDRDTSGLLVFARTADVGAALKAQFAAHKPERVYHAVVAGSLPAGAGTFRSRLVTDAALNQRSTDDPEAGRPAVTHYRVTQRLAGATAVEVRLETGRRNQIRVHFAEAGHPVLGDSRYAPERARHPLWKARRLALHAAVLGFAHPVTDAALRFESPLPAPLADFMARAGAATEVRPAGRSAPQRGRKRAGRPTAR